MADTGNGAVENEDLDETIRAKWTMDGATTLSEAAAKLRAYADELEQRERDGWQLDGPIEDDWGTLVRVN